MKYPLFFCVQIYIFRLNKERSKSFDENGNTIEDTTNIQDFTKITMKEDIFKAIFISPGKESYLMFFFIFYVQ